MAETYRAGGDGAQTILPAPEATAALNEHFNGIVARRRGELKLSPPTPRAGTSKLGASLSASTPASTARKPTGGPSLPNPPLTPSNSLNGSRRSNAPSLTPGAPNGALNAPRSYTRASGGYDGQQTLRDLQRRNGFTHDEARALADEFPGLLRHKPPGTTAAGGTTAETLCPKNW